jgi:hypothetical protein
VVGADLRAGRVELGKLNPQRRAAGRARGAVEHAVSGRVLGDHGHGGAADFAATPIGTAMAACR